jgi:phage baseplate assembly protein gpV
MSLRIGIVVATHPEDHSVDLVMADDGSRLVGVQVVSGSASARSGTVDMPSVPSKSNKWDVRKADGQDQKALVGFAGTNPVVVGFLFPQINQVTSKDPKLRYSRHQSDVEWLIDGDGNVQLSHPGGAYIRIGESPTRVDMAGKNADGNAAFDRNTGRQVNVRVALAGNAVELTMTPAGDVTFKLNKDFTVDAQGSVLIKSPSSVTLQTPQTLCTGNLTVQGAITYLGGMTGSTGAGASATINGNVQVNGNISTTGDVTAGGVVTDSNGDGGA